MMSCAEFKVSKACHNSLVVYGYGFDKIAKSVRGI
jgi:hypothetical protein